MILQNYSITSAILFWVEIYLLCQSSIISIFKYKNRKTLFINTNWRYLFKKLGDKLYSKYANNKILNQPDTYNTTSSYQKPFKSSTKPSRNFVTKFCKQDILKDAVKFLTIFCSFLIVEVYIRKLIKDLSLHNTHVKKPLLTTLLLVKCRLG